VDVRHLVQNVLAHVLALIRYNRELDSGETVRYLPTHA
jgi:hypothetical protein